MALPGFAVPIQQSLRRHDHAIGAVAALRRLRPEKGHLQRIGFAAVRRGGMFGSVYLYAERFRHRIAPVRSS
jgi:hypothetical protein